MPVKTTHPDYSGHLPEWEAMRDALNDEIKDKGEAYLPKTDGQQHIERELGEKGRYLYRTYKMRAEYPRWVPDALRSMMGLVSRVKPEFKAPAGLEYLEREATADGFGIDRLFYRIVREILTTGRVFVLADVDDAGRVYAALYTAEKAINWKETDQRGRRDLSLVVLEESISDGEADEYEHRTKTVYRVLDIKEGRYRVRVLNEDGSQVGEDVAPTNGRGENIGYIPGIFAGSTDNNPDVDEVPLLTMARAAVKAYQLSADYYESLHKTAHPQAWVSSDQEVDFKLSGPGTLWQASADGQFGFLEITGNGIEATRKAMHDQRNAALEAGARVVDVGQQAESGDARRARQDDQHATLHSVVMTAAEAVEQFVRYAIDLANRQGEAVYSVKPEFSSKAIDPQMAQQLLQAAMANLISHESYWEYIRTGKVPDREYDEEALHILSPGLGFTEGE